MKHWIRKKLHRCLKENPDYCCWCKKEHALGSNAFGGLIGKTAYFVCIDCKSNLDVVYMGAICWDSTVVGDNSI